MENMLCYLANACHRTRHFHGRHDNILLNFKPKQTETRSSSVHVAGIDLDMGSQRVRGFMISSNAEKRCDRPNGKSWTAP